MKKITIIILLLTLQACSESIVEQKEERTIVVSRPSDEYKARCFALSKHDLDSGQTERMRAGMATINECLEKRIIDISGQKLGGQNSVVVIEKSLKLLSTGYQRIYWEMSTNNKACLPACGENAQLVHISKNTELLLTILDDLLALE